MEPSSNHYELVRQGLEWLKSQKVELINLYAAKLVTIPSAHFRNLTIEQSYTLANRSMARLIERLEGNSLDTEQIKSECVAMLQDGVQLQDLTSSIDKLLAVLAYKVHFDLENQPEVREALLKKVNYIFQLFKATMAVAMIQFESHRYELERMAVPNTQPHWFSAYSH